MPIAYSADALIYDPGSNSWSLRPDYDIELHRVDIAFSDDDGIFDGDDGADEVGVDAGQTAVVTDMAGNPVASGQVYDEEFYSVWDGINPHIYIERVEIAGKVVGYIVDAPLTLGVSYTQSTSENVEDDNAVAYSTFTDVPCFAPGTQIKTVDGARLIDDLRPGDVVLTVDSGPQTIRWIHHCDQPLDSVKSDSKPVLIRAGALGFGHPENDIILSPQHRVLVGGHGQLQGYFQFEVFVPAKALVDLPGIRFMKGKRDIRWHHFAFDQHHVIWANNCLAESLLLGPMVVDAMSRTDRKNLMRVFGQIGDKRVQPNGPPARRCLSSKAACRALDAGKRRKVTKRHTDGKIQAGALI